MEEVDGSNPSRSTKILRDLAPTGRLPVAELKKEWLAKMARAAARAAKKAAAQKSEALVAQKNRF